MQESKLPPETRARHSQLMKKVSARDNYRIWDLVLGKQNIDRLFWLVTNMAVREWRARQPEDGEKYQLPPPTTLLT